MTVIKERIEKHQCLICGRDIGKINPETMKELRSVKYYGTEVLIHKSHHYEENV